MTGPYPKLYELPEVNDATATAMHILKQYAVGKREDLADTMKILAWMEDIHPHLEEACDQMRMAFRVPPWDRELRKLLGISGYNLIADGLKKSPHPQTQYHPQQPHHHRAAAA